MKTPTPDTIELWGGTLCLDLANSTDWDAHGDEIEPEHNDVLLSPELLARWARRLGVLAQDGVPGPADDELHRVRDLRASIHAVFSAIATGSDPDPGDLLQVHEAFAEATAAGELEPGGEGWRWTWLDDDPRRVRFAIAVDAVSLLTDGERLARRALPGPRVRLALPRPDGAAALVLDGRVRQPREDAAPVRPPQGRLRLRSKEAPGCFARPCLLEQLPQHARGQRAVCDPHGGDASREVPGLAGFGPARRSREDALLVEHQVDAIRVEHRGEALAVHAERGQVAVLVLLDLGQCEREPAYRGGVELSRSLSSRAGFSTDVRRSSRAWSR